jgi:copper chaperone
MTRKTFKIPNISCNHCVMTIKRELEELEGVTQVTGNAETKEVSAEWESPATWDSITSLLAEINYPVE